RLITDEREGRRRAAGHPAALPSFSKGLLALCRVVDLDAARGRGGSVDRGLVGRRRRADPLVTVVVDVLLDHGRLIDNARDARAGRVEDEGGHDAEGKRDRGREEADVADETQDPNAVAP